MKKQTRKNIQTQEIFDIFRNMRKESKLVLILLIISFLLFFFRLGAPSFFETDEVIYSQAAREMIRTRDFVTPHLHSQKWFIHPPMYMWLVAISSFIFGEGEFNSRLWCALAGLGLVFVTYLLGKKLFKDGVGILAGFILATSLQFIIQSRLAIFDVPLAFFIVLGVYFFFCWQDEKDEKYYYLFFAMMGLATLTKGPIGILLPLLILIPYLYYIKDLGSLFNKRIFAGASLSLVLGGTWYLVEALLHGKEFVDSVIGYYLVNRYFGVVETHSGPWFYYIPVIFFGLLPWSAFLPFSLAYQKNRSGDESNLFVILWIGISFVFFSLAGTKLPGYIFCMYPFMAISIAKLLADHISGEDSGLEKEVNRAYRGMLILSIILAIVAFIFGMIEVQQTLKAALFDVNIMILILGIGGVVSSVLYFVLKEDNVQCSIVALVATMLLFTFYTANFTMIHLDEFKPMRTISRQIMKSYKTEDKIINYRDAGYRNSFIFYIDRPISWPATSGQLVRELSTSRRVFLIAKKEDYYNVIKPLKMSIETVYQAGDLMLLSNRKPSPK